MTKRKLMFNKLQEIALDQFNKEMQKCVGEKGTFKYLINLPEMQPILFLGKVEPEYKDGNCIIVSNPSEELVDSLLPDVGYIENTFKQQVSGKCDAAGWLFVLPKSSWYSQTYFARK